MLSNIQLVKIGNFQLKLHHLLVIGILSLSFSVSFLVRSQAADFGFELNEFDPFFNFRATEYLVENGIDAYYTWNDELSWYPHGRNVSATSQVMLHLTAASTYWLFGFDSSLYDFTIIFPVVFSSLTAIVLFALVRVIGGTTAGLLASLLFSISLPLLLRSPIGWFKSEPLGIFFGILALYLFLSAINSYNKKIAFAKIISAGLFTSFSISAWGGNQFFIIVIAVFFLALPFIRNDRKFLLWLIPSFTAATVLSSLVFERGFSISSLDGIVLVGATVFSVSCILVRHFSPNRERRNILIFLTIFMVAGSSLLVLSLDNDILPLPSHRYLNAINPFLTTTDPLVDSVSEHATTTTAQSFLFNSVLMLFAGLGIWLIIKNTQTKFNFIKNDMLIFSLILGLVGIYISSAFIRLEVFSSIALIVLSSLGISILIRQFVSTTINRQTPMKKYIVFSFSAGLIFLLITPLVYPLDSNAISLSKNSITILNGGSAYAIATNDWLDALSWIKQNTPEDSVIAAWWDYGYWIQTMSDRATIADNSTVSTAIIQDIARMLLSSPDDGWRALNDMGADYVLIFVSSNKLTEGSENALFALRGGGDESKKQWFMRIAEVDEDQFLFDDGLSGTDKFWNDTLLGQMFPYSVLGYVNPDDSTQQSPEYMPGTIAIYGPDVKFAADGDGPLKLAYSSPSYQDPSSGPKIGVFIYQVNKDYVPNS